MKIFHAKLLSQLLTEQNAMLVSQLQMLQEASKNSPDDEEALRAIDLLYDAALVSSGFTVSNIIPLFYLHRHF